MFCAYAKEDGRMELRAVEGFKSSSKSRFRSFGRMEKSRWKNGARRSLRLKEQL
jgi:hypothetical protein